MNTTPLPSVAAPPYLCDYIPLDAVRLMTGVQDPVVKGRFTMSANEGESSGGCFIYQSDGPKVLDVTLSPDGSKEEVEWVISKGAKPLPEIVPGSIGHYGQDGSADNTQASATLVHGLDKVIVELWRGVKGRDNTADVVALMKLVGPKLIVEAKTKD
ncbi:hypothetical protein ACIBI9_63505 [Nonomuraea sp. NPDC050451]|uniref:hypothetical protein n=1 Tax=Nonomuraea sp. NPDC050451 TaxID=3364364 RepID=UPI00379770C3